MKFFFLFILFFLKNLCLTSQQLNEQYDFLNYHRQVSQAESLALDSNYTEALHLYSQVFSSFPKIFPKDFLVAAQIASINNNDSLTYLYLQYSILAGASMSRIKELPALIKFQKVSLWNKLVLSKDSLRNIYNSRIDYPVRRIIEDLYRKDQVIRDKNNKGLYTLWYLISPRLISKFKRHKQWQKNCLTSFKVLDSIIAKKGFPSYKLIGCDSPPLPKWNEYIINSNIALIIIYHFNNCYSQFGYKLKQEIIKGNLHPMHYALIRDFEARTYEVGHRNIPDSCKNYAYHVRWDVSPTTMIQNIQNVDEVNRIRSEIGLAPFIYERKKKTAQNAFNYYTWKLPNAEKAKTLIDWFYYDL